MKLSTLLPMVGSALWLSACFYAAGLDEFESDRASSGDGGATTSPSSGGSNNGGATTTTAGNTVTAAGSTSDGMGGDGTGGEACKIDHVVITEVRTAGPDGASDEMVELFNGTTKKVNLDGWRLRFRNPNSSTPSVRWTGDASDAIGPGRHFLIVGGDFMGTHDSELTSSIGDDQVVSLSGPDVSGDPGPLYDVVCMCADDCNDPDWTTCPSELGILNPSSSENPTKKTIQRVPECHDTDTAQDFMVDLATPESM